MCFIPKDIRPNGTFVHRYCGDLGPIRGVTFFYDEGDFLPTVGFHRMPMKHGNRLDNLGACLARGFLGSASIHGSERGGCL